MSIKYIFRKYPSSNNINEVRYTIKVQNDIEYVNTTGDLFTGDLNLNDNNEGRT